MSLRHDIEAFQMLRTRRAEIERTVADLLDLLDAIDAIDANDADLEDSADDEPSLGWTPAGAGFSGTDDREAEGEHDEDGADDEPSLGAPEQHPDVQTMHDPWFGAANGSRRACRSEGNRQTYWSAGRNMAGNNDGEPEAGYDLPEGDDERCGSDVIDEPTLGAPENHDQAPNQERWSQGGACGERDTTEPETARWRSSAEVRADQCVARVVLRQAEAIRRRRDGERPPRDPDELRLVRGTVGLAVMTRGGAHA